MKRRDDSQRSDRLAVTFVDLRVVDRVAASVASWPRLGFDGSMMTRHDDSQRSRPLAVTFGDLRVVDRVAASVASWPRLGFDGSMMTRHDDSQRSRPLAVTATSPPPVAATLAGGRKGRSPRLTWSGEPVTIGSSGIERMPMKRHDDSQRSGRLAVTQPVHPRPPHFFRTDKQLTAPADRRVRDPAHAGAFTTAVAIAIGCAGSAHRQTGMRTGHALPGDRNRPGSPPATDCRQNSPPALPAIQTRCFAGHRPAWGCNADPDVDLEKKEVRMILKEPHARAA